MMNTWKEAILLAKFELKSSQAQLFLCWLILTILSLIFLTSFKGYVEENYIGFDIFFLLVISFGPFWFRSKQFQYRRISNRLWASPVLIMQNELPIPKEVIAKSRLIIYLAYLMPFIFTVFSFLYIFNGTVREMMDLFTYAAFVLIWILYALYFGMIMPSSDAGDYHTPTKMVVSFLISFSLGLGFILFFYQVLGYGIVAWTIMLAQDWAFVAIGISIILVIISWKALPIYMVKTMKKLDYF